MQYLEYLQTPYLHQGHSFKGVDCFGLLYLFYKNELGITLNLPEFDYDVDWWKDKNYFIDLYKQFSFKKITEAPRFGDILLFRNTSTTAGHIGIVLDDGNFMHMSNGGCNIAPFTYGVWARQLHSTYRYVKRRSKKCL